MVSSAASRKNLSVDLTDLVRDLIIDGDLGPGARINEVHLAARLNVSRTPLREALSRLASEGFVTSRPRRGFFVQELGLEHFRNLYDMRAMLDPAALELAGVPSGRQLDRLDAINEQILASRGNTGRTIELDDRWHIELLSHCRNPILLDLIRQFMQRTRPYEHAYLREGGNVEVAVTEHVRIIKALRARKLDRAVAALRQNMQSSIPPLVAWLETRGD